MRQILFHMQAQQMFATLSGDHNPLHLDPEVAATTRFGRTLVHGVHLVLWALAGALAAPVRLARLKVEFQGAVGVGEVVSASVTRSDDQRLDLRVLNGDARAVAIKAWLAASHARVDIPEMSVPVDPCIMLSAADLVPDALIGRVNLVLDPPLLEAVLPGLSALLPTDQVAILLAVTRIIGMQCPGLHSIFTMIDLTFDAPDPSAPPHLGWTLSRFDPRFDQVELAVAGPGVTGTLTAMLRHAVTKTDI